MEWEVRTRHLVGNSGRVIPRDIDWGARADVLMRGHPERNNGAVFTSGHKGRGWVGIKTGAASRSDRHRYEIAHSGASGSNSHGHPATLRRVGWHLKYNLIDPGATRRTPAVQNIGRHTANEYFHFGCKVARGGGDVVGRHRTSPVPHKVMACPGLAATVGLLIG